MHQKLYNLCRQAEEEYMTHLGITAFNINIKKLRQNVEIYEFLRDNEIKIFQPIADELEKAFPQEDPQVLEMAITHWLGIMRYCAMAVLGDNPDYLKYRILEWLTEQIKAHQIDEIEDKIYQLLKQQLQQSLTPQQIKNLQPFFNQIHKTLFKKEKLTKV